MHAKYDTVSHVVFCMCRIQFGLGAVLNASCRSVEILLFATFHKSSDVFFVTNVVKIFLSHFCHARLATKKAGKCRSYVYFYVHIFGQSSAWRSGVDYAIVITFRKYPNAHGIACWISCLQQRDACILYCVVCMRIFLTIFGNFTLLNLR